MVIEGKTRNGRERGQRNQAQSGSTKTALAKRGRPGLRSPRRAWPKDFVPAPFRSFFPTLFFALFFWPPPMPMLHVFSTLAVSAGVAGSADGTGAAARLAESENPPTSERGNVRGNDKWRRWIPRSDRAWGDWSSRRGRRNQGVDSQPRRERARANARPCLRRRR